MFRSVGTLILASLVCAPGHGFCNQSEDDRWKLVEKHVVRLGLPEGGSESEPLREQHALLQELSALHDIEIDVSFGSEYQILDWLERDQIDAGLLSPLSVYLLRRGPWLSAQVVTCGPDPRQEPFHVYQPVAQREENSLPVMMRSARSGARGIWTAGAAPKADFEHWLEELVPVEDPDPSLDPAGRNHVVLVVPTHLSACGFAAPLFRAAIFLDQRLGKASTEEGRKVAARFWSSFFDRAHLLIGPSPEKWDEQAVERLGLFAPPEDGVDRLLIEFRGEDEDWGRTEGWTSFSLTENGEIQGSEGTAPPAKLLILKKALAPQPPELSEYVPTREAAANHVFFERARRALTDLGGPRPWFFSFKIPEVMRLIATDQRVSRTSRLALVLPGGGVKACYQSNLIDHLYRSRFLVNGSRTASSSPALAVSCIAGNSGGALLGSFVAALREGDERVLGEELWRSGEQHLDARSVFPYWDLPRWFTIFACFAVFCVALWLSYWVLRFTKRMEPPGFDEPDARSRLWQSLTWVVILAAIPHGVKYVNGDYGIEHVPQEAGFVYCLCLVLAIAGDSCLVMRSSEAARASKLLVLCLGLLFAGIVAVSLALRSPSSRADDVGPFGMPWPSTLFCLGSLLLLLAVLLWPFCLPHRFKPYKIKEFLQSLVLLALIAGSTTLILWALARFGIGTVMELTGPFWIVLLLTAALVSLALIAVGLSRKPGSSRLRATLEYLWTVHPSGTWRIRRLVRFVSFGFLGWFYWNLVVAPAIYGNRIAEAYLDGRIESFYDKNEDAQMQTTLIVPATALLADEERYFLFSPATEKAFYDQAVARLGRDMRWRVHLGDIKAEILGDFVFASGSPFPVFPAHKVDYEGTKLRLPLREDPLDPEWLVDGGFAHNVPIEAAQLVGARQVLVVQNVPPSPPANIDSEHLGLLARFAGADAASEPPPTDSDLYRSPLSQLVVNLPRVIPFLFQRSQVADDKSREGLFVAALEPSYEESWPFLTDFRSSVVQGLEQAAKDDRDRRIGTVFNWGSPYFFRLSR